MFSPAPVDVEFTRLLADSYRRFHGSPLLPADLAGQAAAEWIYTDAPFCILVHDTSPDPQYIYVNRAAQRCFEYSWDEFIGMPSRLSAEMSNRRERQEFMAAVLRDGYADNYRGLRVAKSGRRFWIEDATLWNVIDARGVLRGQAALIRRRTDA
jgi:PAS domain S-box-containing protein